MVKADRRRCTRSRVGFAALLAVPLVAAGCRLSEERVAAPPSPSPTSTSVPGEPGVVSAAVPIEGYLALDARQLDAERLDEAWRTDAERDRLMRQGIATPGATPAPTGAAPLGTPSPASAASAPVERLRALIASAGGATAAATPAPSSRATPQPSPAAKGKASTGAETWEQISPDAFATFEPRFPIARDGGGPTVLAVQQLLDRMHFSPGAVDGRWGKNTEKAVYWLQAALGLEATGAVDADLFARLREAAGTTNPVRQYTLTSADVAGPFTEIPDDYVKQADLDCLCYRSAAESLAERFHMTGDLLKKLNPDADLEHLAAGTELWVLDVEPFDAAAARSGGGAAGDAPIAELVISKDGFYLQALDANRQVLYHFPTTVGAGYDASPERRPHGHRHLLQPDVPLSAEAVRRRRRQQTGSEFAGGTELARGRRVDAALEGELRHPRHRRAGEHRLPHLARLRPTDQLGRALPRPADRQRHAGPLPRPRPRGVPGALADQIARVARQGAVADQRTRSPISKPSSKSACSAGTRQPTDWTCASMRLTTRSLALP